MSLDGMRQPCVEVEGVRRGVVQLSRRQVLGKPPAYMQQGKRVRLSNPHVIKANLTNR